MRITNNTMVNTVLTNISRNLNQLEDLQSQITSGKRLQRPSDDPADVGYALNLRASISAGAQHLRNMDSSIDWLNATEVSLSSATESLQRVRELAVQGASDTFDASQRATLATEVNQLLEQILGRGNSTLGGQRLFGGFKTNANPFTLSGSTVTYSGDTGQMLREVDVGNTVQVNVIGSTTFNAAFAAVISVRDHLLANDGAAISSTDLPALDNAMTTLLAVRADVGARINRLEASRTRQELLQVRLAELVSKAEDTDFASAITEFTNQETVYKAALAAGSRAIQPSLLDYLR